MMPMELRKSKTPEYALKMLHWNMKWRRGNKYCGHEREDIKKVALRHLAQDYIHLQETVTADIYVDDFREWLKRVDWKYELHDDWYYFKRIILRYITGTLHWNGLHYDYILNRFGWKKWKKEFIKRDYK